ncbi:MAG: ATPase domain-containing protein [Candidatus Hodarchaeota archaeon]
MVRTLAPEFPELDKIDKGYSLLIKGLPGTGKSSLALDLVISFPNSFFISTRINPEIMIQDFPWVLEEIPQNRKYPFFVDATRSRIQTSSNHISKMNYETMPEFVQQLFTLGADLPNKIIAIDSWNALTLNLSESQVSHWASAIIQHLGTEASKIIFVIEGIQSTSLDWIVDGISVLSKKTITSAHGIPRRIRELSFHKMRGREIQNETYLASLAKGRLTTFYPFKYRFPAIILKSDAIGDPDDRHISTGSVGFDDLLGGGFERGSWNLFEVTTTIGEALDIVFLPLITNHLNNDRPAITIFREGVSFDSNQPYLDVFTGSKNWIEQTVNIERHVPENTTNRFELPEKIDQLLEILDTSKQTLQKKIGGPFLVNLGLDALENKYGIPALNEFIAITVSKARLEGDVIVGWLKENQEFRGGTTAATSHWKLDLINRALVLEGVIPATEYYAISPILSKGYIDYKLTPVI